MKPSQPLSRHLLRAALMATLVPLLTMVALGLWQYHEDTDRVERFTGEVPGGAPFAHGTYLKVLCWISR